MRVLIEGALSGEENMRRDALLLEGFRQGDIPPTLRLYRWDRPTISYGYAQRLPEVLVETCTELGIPLVRRPTGGKAVLHGHDLTVSLVFDNDGTRGRRDDGTRKDKETRGRGDKARSPKPEALISHHLTTPPSPHLITLRSPRVVYDLLAPLFIEAFRLVNVPATRGDNPAPNPLSAEDGGDCFATPAITDIVHAETGIKLVGCALRVTDRGTLMQASIPLEPPQVPVERLFGHPHPNPPFQNLECLIKAICEVFTGAIRGKKESLLRGTTP